MSLVGPERHIARNANSLANEAEIDARSGWRDLPALLFVALLERISSGVGETRGYTIRIRGISADVWSPHTVLGRGVPCRRIVASSHGLGCEYGCRDQHGRHEGHFGHLFLHMVAEAKEALSSLL
jgi:hypothetical protein